MRVLSVAEKPSIARRLAEVLGNGRAGHRRGLDQYSANWDVDNVSINVDGRHVNAKMTITSVRGHVTQLDFESAFKGWNSCSPSALFKEAPVVKTVPEAHENLQRNLEREARGAHILMLWLDCDREGENICFEVMDICCRVNRRLRPLRARFSAVTANDVLHAMEHLEQPNQLQSDAVDARQEIDLRIGAAFTRFQTLVLRNRFESLVESLVSYGPCQFPCLGFVAERYARIESFIPEDFWKIRLSAQVEVREPPVEFHWKRQRVYDHGAAIVFLERCLRGGEAVIVDVRGGSKTKRRPLPLQTIKLQQLSSRYLHISPDRTMDIAEKLYQKGILSYPRTETEIFNRNIDVQGLVRQQSASPEWGDYASRLLQISDRNTNSFLWPREDSTRNDEAHPPIHPVRFASGADFDDHDQKRLYELVTRHFLACCSRDAVGVDSTVEIEIGGHPTESSSNVDSSEEQASPEDEQTGVGGVQPRTQWWSEDEEEGFRENGQWVVGEIFEARGLQVLQRNWLEVYRYENWTGRTLPTMTQGARFKPSELRIEEGRTAPPLPLNEEQLLALMERHGIGTDATMAEHIKKVQERDYIFKTEERRFLPRPLGIALLEAYKVLGVPGIGMPNLRAAMERDCNEVAAGRLARQDMIDRCTTQMKAIFEIVAQKVPLFVEVVSRRLSRLGMESEDEADRNDAATDGENDENEDPGDGHGGGSSLNRSAGRARRRSVSQRRKRPRSDNFRTVQRKFSVCGNCKQSMELREHLHGQPNSRRGPKEVHRLQYLFCRKCGEGHPLPVRGEFQPFNHRCPMCDFQILNVVPGRGYAEHRHPYKLCPNCFSNVPPRRGANGRRKVANVDVEEVLSRGPIGAAEEDGTSESTPAVDPGTDLQEESSRSDETDPVLSNFTCAQCAYSGCALAQSLGSGSDAAVCKCPYCTSGTMSLGKLKESYKISCGRYPECKATIWLQGLIDAKIGPACERCNAKRITMTFDATTAIIAMKYLDDLDTRKCTTCIRCNIRLWKEMGIAKEAKSKESSRQARSRPGDASSSAAKRSRRDIVVVDDEETALRGHGRTPGENTLDAPRCYRCNQTGHYANACPQNRRTDSAEERRSTSSVCYNCNQPGHFASQCPRPRQRAQNGEATRPGATSMVCYVCQQPGHFASNCPNRGSHGGTDVRSRVRNASTSGGQRGNTLPLSGTCFKCKQSGHFANQCPNG